MTASFSEPKDFWKIGEIRGILTRIAGNRFYNYLIFFVLIFLT